MPRRGRARHPIPTRGYQYPQEGIHAGKGMRAVHAHRTSVKTHATLSHGDGNRHPSWTAGNVWIVGYGIAPDAASSPRKHPAMAMNGTGESTPPSGPHRPRLRTSHKRRFRNPDQIWCLDRCANCLDRHRFNSNHRYDGSTALWRGSSFCRQTQPSVSRFHRAHGSRPIIRLDPLKHLLLLP